MISYTSFQLSGAGWGEASMPGTGFFFFNNGALATVLGDEASARWRFFFVGREAEVLDPSESASWLLLLLLVRLGPSSGENESSMASRSQVTERLVCISEAVDRAVVLVARVSLLAIVNVRKELANDAPNESRSHD